MALLRKARRFNRQVPRLLRSALVDLNSSGIESTAGAVTAWRNSGSGGSAYDLDTILGTAANLRSHSSGAMLLDGVSGSYASAPDSPANSVTGDITLIAYAALADWTPPTDDRALFGKWGSTGLISYLFRVEITTGKLVLGTSSDGTTAILSKSTVAPSFTDGTGHWVRATLDVSGDVSNFFTSDDPPTTAYDAITWTQLGTADVAHVSTGIADTTSLLTIGAQKDAGNDDMLNGQIHRAGIISGLDATATPAVDFNPTLAGRSATGLDSDTFVSSDGATYTLHGGAVIQNSGQDEVKSYGAAGLETTVAPALITTPMTMFLVGKMDIIDGTVDVFTAARSDAANEPYIGVTGAGAWTFNAGSNLTVVGVDTTVHLHTARHNGDASSSYEVSGSAKSTGSAGTENYDYGSLFIGSTLTAAATGSIARHIIFPSALPDSKVTLLNHFLTPR